MRNWLKLVRKGRGMSQQEVADAAGISQSYYAAIETGDRGHKLPQPTAARIASVLGIEWTRFYDSGEAS